MYHYVVLQALEQNELRKMMAAQAAAFCKEASLRATTMDLSKRQMCAIARKDPEKRSAKEWLVSGLMIEIGSSGKRRYGVREVKVLVLTAKKSRSTKRQRRRSMMYLHLQEQRI